MNNIFKTKSFYLLSLMVFSSFYTIAQKRFPKIADSLVNNADRVIRLYSQEIDIRSKDLVLVNEQINYSVLNANGEEPFNFWYDDMHLIEHLHVEIYDSLGKLIKQIHKRDFIDRPAGDKDEVLDHRILFSSFTYPIFPYTVIIEIEKKQFETFNLPSFIPVTKPRVSLEKATFRLESVNDIGIRFLADSLSNKYFIDTQNTSNFNFEIGNLIANNEFVINENRYVILAVNNFSYANYIGKLNSWKEIGKFITTLNESQQNIPESLFTELKSITKDVESKEEKVKLVYQYLQDNYRYVSIQLGIGGFQPIEAKKVYQNKFGDCKGLSNLMVACLQAIQIPSFYGLALIQDEYHLLNANFPSNSFNHAIAIVPLEKDTMWLECTSNLLPANVLSPKINKYVLLVNGDESNLVKLKKQNYDSILCKTEGSMEDYKKLIAHTSLKFCRQSFLTPLYIHAHKDERWLQYIQQNFSDTKIDSTTFHYKKYNSIFPVTINFTIQKEFQTSSKRIFFSPPLWNQVQRIKIQGLVLKHSYFFQDSVIVQLNFNLPVIEYNPFDDIHISDDIASYTCNLSLIGNKLLIVRNILLKAQDSSIGYSKKLDHFLEKIMQIENEKIVINHE